MGLPVVFRVLLSEMYDLILQNFTTLRLVHTALALTCRLDRIDLSYHIMLHCHNIDTNALAISEHVSKQCLNNGSRIYVCIQFFGTVCLTRLVLL